MCGITGVITHGGETKYWDLLKVSEIRGQDGTGFHLLGEKGTSIIERSPLKASEVDFRFDLKKGMAVIGQNRLAIFGLDQRNNQPLVGQRYSIVHNGNLFSFEEVFQKYNIERRYEVDTELILRLMEYFTNFDRPNTLGLERAIRRTMEVVQGNFACLVLDKALGLLVAFRRNKPLWITTDQTGTYFFSTERIGKKVFGNPNPMWELEEEKVYMFEIERRTT